MGKRANGEGSVYKRTDGRWAATLTYVDAAGATKRQTFYGKTQADVRAKLKEAKGRTEKGAPPKDARVRLGEFTERWIATTLAASDRKDTTKQVYAGLARTHVVGGAIGSKTLDRVKPTDVEGMVLALRAAGKSDATVRQVYTVLRAVLDAAVRDGLLGANPAEAVKRPGVARKEAKHLGGEDLRRLLDEGDKGRYGRLLRLLALTGLRRGEALALRWQDVDLDRGTLRVAGTLSRVNGSLTITEPKTDRSRRSVPLPLHAVEVLRRQKERQDEERWQAAGAKAWTESGLVFTTEAGTPVDPRNALRALRVAAKAAGLEDVGLHTLRHSAATALLEAGVPLVTVSEILGHSSVAITGDVYGHVSTHGARAAMDVLGAEFGGGSQALAQLSPTTVDPAFAVLREAAKVVDGAAASDSNRDSNQTK